MYKGPTHNHLGVPIAAMAGALAGPTHGTLCVYEKTDEKSFHRTKELKLEGGGIRSVTVRDPSIRFQPLSGCNIILKTALEFVLRKCLTGCGL